MKLWKIFFRLKQNTINNNGALFGGPFIFGAEMIPKSLNLVHYVQDCKTFNVRNSMKEAKQIAGQWNEEFKANRKKE